MAEEILVKEPLTDKMIEAGNRLLSHIKEPLELIAAFWLYKSEYNRWQLMLATPQAALGVRQVYSRVQEVLRADPGGFLGLELSDIGAFGPTEPLVKELVRANQRYDQTNTRSPRSSIGGIYVDDLYVYFVRDTTKPRRGAKYHVSDSTP